MPGRALTPLQFWWRAEADLLADARDELGPDWSTFLSILASWVAAESPRLDLEERTAS